KRRSQRILAGVLILTVGSLFGLYMYFILKNIPQIVEDSSTLDVILQIVGSFVVAVLLPAWLGMKILSMMLRGKTALQTFGRMSVAFFLAFLPVMLTGGLIVLTYGIEPLTAKGMTTTVQSGTVDDWGAWLKAAVIVFGLGFSAIFTVV